MKKTLVLLFILSSSLFAQFGTNLSPWRVVTVSPNFTNIYPRYNTLQQAYNSIKDSASSGTGKYFIINATTAYNNITDWSSQWKDSISNRAPYMRLTAFGQIVTDSILGVTTEEFDLIAGILNLDPATAGDGLSFGNHKYSVNYKIPITISNDTLLFLYSAPLYLTPNTLGLDRKFNNGMIVDSGGLGINGFAPLIVSRDSLKFLYAAPFVIENDTFKLKLDDRHFAFIGDSIIIKLDSGLTQSITGIAVNTDGMRLGVNSSKKITIKDRVAGTGLTWDGDSLIVGTMFPLSIDASNKYISLNYSTDQFAMSAPAGNVLRMLCDSGLYVGTNNSPAAIRIKTDNVELGFNTSSQIETRSTLWGDGLYKTGDSGNVMVNEFAKIENDTVKIKTSYTMVFYGDSLTTNVTSTGTGILPFDTTGVPIIYTGKIKRITYTYQLSSGNDTVIADNQNTSVTFGDKIRASWNNGGSKFNIQKWSQSSRSWSTAIQLNFANFANKPYRVTVELYSEAQ